MLKNKQTKILLILNFAVHIKKKKKKKKEFLAPL